MKLFLALLISLPVFADVYTVRVDASASNIPTSFSTAATSRKVYRFDGMTGLLVNNRLAAEEVAVNCQGSPETAPSNSDANNIYLAAGEAYAIDNVPMTGNCYIRSMSGSPINVGYVVITATRK